MARIGMRYSRARVPVAQPSVWSNATPQIDHRFEFHPSLANLSYLHSQWVGPSYDYEEWGTECELGSAPEFTVEAEYGKQTASRHPVGAESEHNAGWLIVGLSVEFKNVFKNTGGRFGELKVFNKISTRKTGSSS